MEAEEILIPQQPAVCNHDWYRSNKKTRDCEIKLGSVKFEGRKLVVEALLLPEITKTGGNRMAKLKVKIKLNIGTALLQHYLFNASVTATLLDPDSPEKPGNPYEKHVSFEACQHSVSLLVNLARCEDVERIKSKKLEIRLEVLVRGTKRRAPDQYQCTEEEDDYCHITSQAS